MILLLGFNGFIYVAGIGERKIFVHVNRIIRKDRYFLIVRNIFHVLRPDASKTEKVRLSSLATQFKFGDLTANFGE